MKLLQLLLKFWVLIIALAFGTFVCVINTDPVVMRLPPDMELRMPLAMTLISGFLYGASTVILFFFFDIAKKTLEVRKLQKQLADRELSAASKPSDLSEPTPFTGTQSIE